MYLAPRTAVWGNCTVFLLPPPQKRPLSPRKATAFLGFLAWPSQLDLHRLRRRRPASAHFFLLLLRLLNRQPVPVCSSRRCAVCFFFFVLSPDLFFFPPPTASKNAVSSFVFFLCLQRLRRLAQTCPSAPPPATTLPRSLRNQLALVAGFCLILFFHNRTPPFSVPPSPQTVPPGSTLSGSALVFPFS